MRLDPRSGKVNKTIHLGGTPNAFAADAGRVWVAVAPAAPHPPASGGVAHFTLQSDFSTYDPAVGSVGPLVYATCANLVTYPERPAPKGSRIVPAGAEAGSRAPAPRPGGP